MLNDERAATPPRYVKEKPDPGHGEQFMTLLKAVLKALSDLL
jgi:hypothetical protein